MPTGQTTAGPAPGAPPAPDAAAGPRTDGRAARSERTRAALIAAHADLLSEGDPAPTASRIAGRAGVSVRALWTHFTELEALYGATAGEVLARLDARFVPVDPGLPLAARIGGFCDQRARLLEAITPFARASAAREPTSPVLRRYHAVHVRRVADEVEALFGPELRALPGPARADRVAGLTAAATWGAWSVLRDDLGLAVPRARDVLASTVAAVLGTAAGTAAGPAGGGPSAGGPGDAGPAGGGPSGGDPPARGAESPDP